MWQHITVHGVFGHTWKGFLKHLWREMDEDNAFSGAAALAFFALLSLFPAAIFLLTLLPYLQISDLQASITGFLNRAMPGSAASLFDQTIREITVNKRGGLLSFGGLLTLWAASSGIFAAMKQLNIAHRVRDTRSYLRMRLVALGLTVSFSILVVTAFSLIVLGQESLNWLATTYDLQTLSLWAINLFRWLAVMGALLSAFALIYYFGPDVDAEFRFITPGSVLGVILLILATLGFKFYVENFGNYSATYGSIGAVIVLMLWLYLMGIILLLGAETNALLESYSGRGAAAEKGLNRRSRSCN